MSALRQAAARVAPAPVLYEVLKRTVGPGLAPKPIDLTYVDILRQQDPADLADPRYLEKELLPRLGLNNESLHQLPAELHEHTGYGLLHWQLPSQFSKYLVDLTNYRIERYLEIGTRHGGTFVITVEFLNKFRPIQHALGVDFALHPSLRDYAKLNPRASFKRANSQSPAFRRFVQRQEPFDLVLIDGDHSEDGCRHDFETVRDKARIVVFHDIVSDPAPGVIKVWEELKASADGRWTFHEYTDQYEEFTSRGESLFGIGVAVSEDAVRRD